MEGRDDRHPFHATDHFVDGITTTGRAGAVTPTDAVVGTPVAGTVGHLGLDEAS